MNGSTRQNGCSNERNIYTETRVVSIGKTGHVCIRYPYASPGCDSCSESDEEKSEGPPEFIDSSECEPRDDASEAESEESDSDEE